MREKERMKRRKKTLLIFYLVLQVFCCGNGKTNSGSVSKKTNSDIYCKLLILMCPELCMYVQYK